MRARRESGHREMKGDAGSGERTKKREVKGTGGEGEEEEEEEKARPDYGSNKALMEKKARGHHAATKAAIISFPALYYTDIKRAVLHLISHDLASSLGRQRIVTGQECNRVCCFCSASSQAQDNQRNPESS